jgi:hypothetical protein
VFTARYELGLYMKQFNVSTQNKRKGIALPQEVRVTEGTRRMLRGVYAFKASGFRFNSYLNTNVVC